MAWKRGMAATAPRAPAAVLQPRRVSPIQDWDPGPIDLPLRFLVGSQIVALLVLALQALAGITRPSHEPFAMALAALAGWALADLISGRVHKWLDAYGDERTFLFGGMVREFQHHHRVPFDATRMHWPGGMRGAARLTLPLSLAAAWWPGGPIRQAFILFLLLGLVLSQVAHNYAHLPAHRRPRWLEHLQRWRLFLPHASHVRCHHHAPWDEYFEPLCGWWSPLFARSGYNRLEERLLWYLFGLVPRPWERLELAPPSYRDPELQRTSGFARWRYDRLART